MGGADDWGSLARGVYSAPIGAMIRVASRRELGQLWNERRTPWLDSRDVTSQP